MVDGRPPSAREEEAVEVSAPLEAAATAAAKVETVDAGTSSSDLKAEGMSAIEISAMAEQLRSQACTADEAIGLSGVVCYGRWINRSQRPDVNFGDSLCALKVCRDLDKAPNAKTLFRLAMPLRRVDAPTLLRSLAPNTCTTFVTVSQL